jgi:hypothetical protein
MQAAAFHITLDVLDEMLQCPIEPVGRLSVPTFLSYRVSALVCAACIMTGPRAAWFSPRAGRNSVLVHLFASIG